MRRCDDFRVIGKPEVVVCAKIEDVSLVPLLRDVDGGLLGAGYQAFGLVETLPFEGFGLIL